MPAAFLGSAGEWKLTHMLDNGRGKGGTPDYCGPAT